MMPVKTLIEALQQLPDPKNYRANYFRVALKPEFGSDFWLGCEYEPPKALELKCFEFKKSSDSCEWIIVSMPEVLV